MQVFLSTEFTDEAILNQLESEEHQMLVGDHGPSELKVCTITLAKTIRGSSCSTRTEALAAINGLGVGRFELEALDGLRTIAESFLQRSTSKQRGLPTHSTTATTAATAHKGEDPLLGQKLKGYTVHRFLAKGSGGLIYTATTLNDGESFVAKLLFESGAHEYEIAQQLKGLSRCIQYLDCITSEQGQTWFILPLVQPNVQGFSDLRQYIAAANDADNRDGLGSQQFAQRIALQLLEGLEQVSSRGIVLRDVKPDNVLVDRTGNVFWADFGLAVDLHHLHSPEKDLVAYWYDVCKLIPRPKWQARRPPERAFQFSAPPSAFDSYMLGIIFVCMACGIDFPHLDQAEMKHRTEVLLGSDLPTDYLKSFELGRSLSEFPAKYLARFQTRFGSEFGLKLFQLSNQMLSRDPGQRPSPSQGLAELLNV
ncbi:hypothetical protein BASA81_008303 [Batrachochytrium salamandrivorans]|nr:hypothetical protein BASA81_008303 [Batrachochytrium salamandrivorans]